MSEISIVPCNWERFQHPDVTRTGHAPWVKVYTRLLHDDNYLQLSGHRRAILHGLWLEYAMSRSRLRLDTRSLSYRLNLRVTTKDLEALSHAGFIEFLQADCKQAASSLARAKETETETEEPKTLNQRSETTPKPEARTPLSEKPKLDQPRETPQDLTDIDWHVPDYLSALTEASKQGEEET